MNMEVGVLKNHVQTHNKSLDEINNTVSINTHGKFSQKLFSFLGQVY